jgi:putative ABC transport system permease protein
MGGTILVRTAADAATMIRPVQEAIRHVDPEQPIDRIKTLEQVRANSLASPKLTMMLVGLFAALALVITAIGIAGVVSFSVSQRVTEIGVRMALGAGPTSVMGLVLRQGMTPVVVGLALGLAGALALTRVMERLLFGIHGTDAVTFAAVPLLLAGVAIAACVAPSRRAASIDPIVALRAN